jgi:ABC-type transport system involved in cytochrome c biogenesis permease component
MTFLPIVTRELRVSARRRRTYWVRFATAALALLFFGWSVLFLHMAGAATFAGKMLFGGLVALIWIYAILGGVFQTADTLSEEKREGTLGLLFLTDLKGYDIVLGKMVAASVNWFFGLIALFPILALSLLFGGVAPGEFWRQMLALTNLLFCSLAVGMFVSALARNERRAAGGTILLLLTLLFLPELLIAIYQKSAGMGTEPLWFVLPDVKRPMQQAADVLYRRSPGLYWGSLGVTHALGWLALLLASLIVPRTWQQSAGKISHWQEKAGQFAYGRNPSRRRAFRQRALDLNPFYWIAARARGQSTALYLLLGGIGVYCFIDFWIDPKNRIGAFNWIAPAIILHSIVKLWIALAAGRRFVEDRRSGALELILSTPLSERAIIHGQWRALLRQFLGPVALVLVVEVLLFFFCQAAAGNSPGREKWLNAGLFVAGVIVFLTDVIALGWLAMWRGLKARHTYTAWLWSTVQILVLPWILFYVAMTTGMMAIFLPQVAKGGAGMASSFQRWGEWLPLIFTHLWLVISLMVAVVSTWWAWRCLPRYFRYQATLAYQPQKAVWSPSVKSATLPPRIA